MMIRREFLALLAGSALAGRIQAVLRPPLTAKRPLRIVQLGRVRVDDYAWLKPANWKAVWRDPARLDPEIRRHLEDEEGYATEVLAPIEGLRRRLAKEMAGWVTPNRDQIVAREAGWTFLARQPAGATHPRYFRARNGAEELVLDVGARAAGLPFLSVSDITVSPDGRLFGWAEDRTGAEKRTLFIKNLITGHLLQGPTDAYGDFVFSADSRWLLWTWRDANSRPSRIYRRALPGGADTLVYEESDPGFLLHLSMSNSRRYVFMRAFNDVTSEVRLMRSDRAADPPVLVEPRREGVIYSLEHWGDGFVVLTNADGALDFKLMRAPEA
ncbi:MAG TPA: S9 family peptidase, partial [Caulobacteraceae bacterium]|nr:S9 family peptidase [Caulobacteraceae bacterium]